MPGTHRGTGTGTGGAGGGAHAAARRGRLWPFGVLAVAVVVATGIAMLLGTPSPTGTPPPLSGPTPVPGTSAPSPLQARLDELAARSPLLFDGDRSELTPADVAALGELADALRAEPGTAVVVTGHTAPVDGDPARCQQISQARADAVARWLEGAGIAPERLRTVGMSHSESEHGETWTQARRVELRAL